MFNVLLVFLPVAGLFSIRSLELELLDLQERSMVQQGRLVAATLGGEMEGLSAENAYRLIERLGGRSESRIRVVDRQEKVLADSAALPARPAEVEEKSYLEAHQASRNRLLYRIGATLWRPLKRVRDWMRRSTQSPRSAAAADVTPRTVVRKALAGRYAATLQESAGQRSLTLYSVLPITAAPRGQVVGAVIVSQSTSKILRALWRIRLDIFEIFAVSVLVAVVLSLLVSATIARPLIRLRDEADDLLDHRGRLKRTFRGSRRRDEIGDLTRALERLTARLERHLGFVESFSADVSHEFKNPLASIRSAAELLASTDDEQEKAQLRVTIEKEVTRLNRLLNGVREVSRVDAALESDLIEPVDLRGILTELAAQSVELVLPPDPIVVAASGERLRQALSNILDNAVSFSPPGGRIRVAAHVQDAHGVVDIDDEGPGIPPEHLERIFDRFFSFRPGAAQRSEHDGLGLAIARAVVEGYGGTIAAANRTPHGARIQVRMPIA
jgi:two-component system sensor histidine kinase ChvG